MNKKYIFILLIICFLLIGCNNNKDLENVVKKIEDLPKYDPEGAFGCAPP